MNDTQVFTVHLPLSLAERINTIANRLNLTRDCAIQQAISDWVEKEEAQYRLTGTALADADNNQTIGAPPENVA